MRQNGSVAGKQHRFRILDPREVCAWITCSFSPWGRVIANNDLNPGETSSPFPSVKTAFPQSWKRRRRGRVPRVLSEGQGSRPKGHPRGYAGLQPRLFTHRHRTPSPLRFKPRGWASKTLRYLVPSLQAHLCPLGVSPTPANQRQVSSPQCLRLKMLLRESWPERGVRERLLETELHPLATSSLHLEQLMKQHQMLQPSDLIEMLNPVRLSPTTVILCHTHTHTHTFSSSFLSSSASLISTVTTHLHMFVSSAHFSVYITPAWRDLNFNKPMYLLTLSQYPANHLCRKKSHHSHADWICFRFVITHLHAAKYPTLLSRQFTFQVFKITILYLL